MLKSVSKKLLSGLLALTMVLGVYEDSQGVGTSLKTLTITDLASLEPTNKVQFYLSKNTNHISFFTLEAQ